jgi:hypothetical protein
VIVSKSKKPQEQVRSNKRFSEIIVNGDVDLVIKPNTRNFTVKLKGDRRELSLIKTTIKNNVLIISRPDYLTKYSTVTVTVASNKLRSLRYNGNGNISAKKLQTSQIDLDLHVNGNVNLAGKINVRQLFVSGKNKVYLKGLSSKSLQVRMHDEVDVKIQGMVNLRHLEFAGSGTLGIHWVNSSDLDLVGSGNAKVHLAGKAHYLHAVVKDNAELDARYLRVNKAYIKASDHSIARLVPIKELNAFASDHGHIYYYQSPQFKAGYMAQNGAILNFARYR